MRLLPSRPPRVERLARRGDIAGLVDALDYEDPLLARSGERIDLGVEVRMAAVHALAALGGADADEGLVRALADPDLGVRQAAVHALAGRGSVGHDALARAAAQWRAPELEAARADAVAALGRADDGAGACAFAAATLAGDHEPAVHDATILRELGQGQQGRALEEAIALLTSRLTDGSAARPAAILLGWLAPESVPALLAALDDPPARPAASMALGATHDARAVAPLADLLRHSDHVATRAAAARALGEIMDPAAAEALMIATGDAEYAVRIHAIDSFNRLGSVAVTVALGAIVRGALAPPAPSPSEPRGDALLFSGEPVASVEAAPSRPAPAPPGPVPVPAPPRGDALPRRESVWRRVLGR